MTMMKILRRGIALCMVLALVVVPGVLSNADQLAAGKSVDQKTGPEGCMIAPWDRIDKGVDAEGRTIVEYFRADALIRRDVNLADGRIEVWIVAADGKTLELSSTLDAPVVSDPSTSKYVDEQGRTVIDTFENGFLYTREIIDYDTGEHSVTVFDKDGNPIDGKSWTEPATPVDPNPAYDDSKKYVDKDGNTVCEYLKDGVVIRREIYYADRMEVYVLDAAGNLSLEPKESQVYPTAAPQLWTDSTKYLDKDGNTVVDFLKDGVVVRREIYKNGGGMEVYELDASGTLVLTVTD